MILASASPRRHELIKLLVDKITIQTKEVEEIIDLKASPQKNVQDLARLKALAVAQENEDKLVIGADTVVCLDGQIMGKPTNKQEAKEMLRKLSGRTHEVCTGVALIQKSKGIDHTFVETTNVTMKALSDEEIDYYVSTKEPMDKAGSYGIQGKGALYISHIDGDYYNVMGLPVHRLYETLKIIK
ncbi:Maf family protein [Cellulosilyticum ruminicola]|uniref:Maf family protein n=1 Tax=Cellulosilyticum ruminicola TaxID=425254 RepID=UPI0006D1435D|nr:Maf family protein [Cellulosilyticum ruminicola]